MTWGGFAQPAWLWGLLGLLAPVAIHLLSRGRHPRIAMGSIRWLAPAESVRVRRVRLSRWGLLALRCLILALLALWLAGPRLHFAGPPGAVIWVLATPEILAERGELEPANGAAYAELDALVEAGAELRALTPPSAHAGSDPEPATDLWALIELADHDAPGGVEFEVFTLDRLSALAGARPLLGRPFRWHELSDPRPNRWLERIAFEAGAPTEAVIATSDPGATVYERRALTDGVDAGVRIERQGDGWRLELVDGGSVATDDALSLSGPPPPLQAVLFVEAERAADAARVRAALAAAAEAVDLELEVRESPPGTGEAVGDAKLVFWLTAAPVPAAILAALESGGLLVSDVLDRAERCDCWVGGGEARLARFDRLGPVDPTASRPVPLAVATGGRTVLDAVAIGSGRWIRYASRFSPSWTDWVLRPGFPEWLAGLVGEVAPSGPAARGARSDRRAMAGEARPLAVSAESESPPNAAAAIERALWLLLMLGLLAERLWGWRGAT